MIVTPLKVFRLSTRSEPIVRVDRLVLSQVEEFFAWYRGEEACDIAVRDVINIISRRMSELKERRINETKKIKLTCTDGEISQSKEMLRRHYQLFDDFFADFPDEERVNVPFTVKQVTSALMSNPLRECYECLSYFNPKSILLYFDHSTRDTPRDVLINLTNQLTYQERKCMLEARRMNKVADYPLPDEGMGLGILAYVLEVHYDSKNAINIFSGYPSYITMTSIRSHSILRLLLTCNYDSGEMYDKVPNCHLLFSSIGCLGSSEFFQQATYDDKKKYISRIMTIMGVHHPLFENEGKEVTLPYYTYWDSDYDEELDEGTVSEVFNVPESVLLEMIRNKRRMPMEVIDLDKIDFGDE